MFRNSEERATCFIRLIDSRRLFNVFFFCRRNRYPFILINCGLINVSLFCVLLRLNVECNFKYAFVKAIRYGVGRGRSSGTMSPVRIRFKRFVFVILSARFLSLLSYSLVRVKSLNRLYIDPWIFSIMGIVNFKRRSIRSSVTMIRNCPFHVPRSIRNYKFNLYILTNRFDRQFHSNISV